MAILKDIKNKTDNFISKYISPTSLLPIKIECIVKKEGIAVRYCKLEDNMSGLLIIQGPSRLIGIEESHVKERQRFTLAHELGHYILHNEKSNIFVDTILFKRQMEGYTSKEEKWEREANFFAANILMPEQLVKREVHLLEGDLYDDDNVRTLAKKFNVSLSAMTFRLTNMGLI